MPVDKQVLLRYQVLNDCFRNPYREYDIDALVDACSDAMREKLDMPAGVSKRTVQEDIKNLQLYFGYADFGEAIQLAQFLGDVGIE